MMLLYRFHPTMMYVVDTFLTNTGLSNHIERTLNLARLMTGTVTKRNEEEY